MNARSSYPLFPVLFLVYCLTFFLLNNGFGQNANIRLDAELADLVQKTKTSEKFPVFILFSKQGSWQDFERLFKGLKKEERRAQTIARLKSLSESTYHELELWLQNSLSETEVVPARRFWLVNGIEASCSAKAIYKMADWPEVARIYLRTEKPVDFIKKDPKWARLNVAKSWLRPMWKEPFMWEGKEISWNLKNIRADHVWSQGYAGHGVIVAVLDSGMNISHPDIKDNLWVNKGEIPENGKDDENNGYIDDYFGWNFAEENQNITDEFFHGTLVGGLIAGDGVGGIITGVAPRADLMILKTYAYDLTKKYGARLLWQAFQYDKWLALQYALDNGAHIANLSFDYQPSEKPLSAPWRYVLANASYCGLACVAGAGNSRGWLKDPDQITPPANIPEVMAVGATAEDGRIDRVSSRGPVTWQHIPPFLDFPLLEGLVKPDLCAPIGRCPYVSFSSNGYDYLSGEGGTSSSSPHVAGVVALMLEKCPELLPRDIKKRLEETCVELGWPGKDNYYGWGRVDAFEAVNYGTAPNIRLMAWKINEGESIAIMPGQQLDVQLDFMVSACPITNLRVLANSTDQDLTITDKEKAVVFPNPILNNQEFSIRIHGNVSETCLASKRVNLHLFLNAEVGRKFHFEIPVFIGRSDTLVVDDDGDGENEKPIMQGLEHAQRAYHVLNTRRENVDGRTLAKYKHVIWETGEEFRDTLDRREQSALKEFMNNGGHLLLLGDNIGDELGKTDFYRRFLHAQVIKEALSGNYARVEFKIFGKGGDPLSKRMTLPTYINYKQYDLIRPLEGADDPFRADLEASYMGFVRYRKQYKLLYTSLGMEAIEDVAIRADLLNRILDWFEN